MPARIATFLAAVLLAGSLFLAFVATQNFATVDRVLTSPPAAAGPMIAALGPQNSRLFLRYLAGEENRLFFQDWEIAELALSAALTVVCWWSLKSRLLGMLATVALAISAVQHFAITPKLVEEGIAIAFSTAPDRLAHFGKLHAIYGVVELLNLALVAAVTIVLISGKGILRRSSPRDSSAALAQHAPGAQGFLHQGQ